MQFVRMKSGYITGLKQKIDKIIEHINLGNSSNQQNN